MTEQEVPVLTEIVHDDLAPRAQVIDPATLEALARHLERAVLERLGPEIERVVNGAFDAARGELGTAVTHMVREAVAASLAHTLARPRRD